MDSAMYAAATGGQVFGYVLILIAGVAVVVALVWAVRLGMKVREREPSPPRPHEQPQPPASGPVHETSEVREPDAVPRAADESERLTPHELNAADSRRADDQRRRRWSPGSSGSFGSGGSGRT
jgi:hypothetical protein